jgi:hypothetical protein
MLLYGKSLLDADHMKVCSITHAVCLPALALPGGNSDDDDDIAIAGVLAYPDARCCVQR